MSKEPETKLERIDRIAGYGVLLLSAALLIGIAVLFVLNHHGPFL